MDQQNHAEMSRDDALLSEFAKIMDKTEPDELEAGYEELVQSHPEADLTELSGDPVFAMYARGRGADLKGAYEGYQALVAAAQERADRRMKLKYSRATGSGSAKTGMPSGGLSDERRVFLAKWNREHPEYSMTAKEYAASLSKGN